MLAVNVVGYERDVIIIFFSQFFKSKKIHYFHPFAEINNIYNKAIIKEYPHIMFPNVNFISLFSFLPLGNLKTCHLCDDSYDSVRSTFMFHQHFSG